MDVSSWPGLSVETDGIRLASEYDAMLLASEPLETQLTDNSHEELPAVIAAPDVGLAEYDAEYGVAAMILEPANRYDQHNNWRGGPGL
jgi:hypothetical protein